MGILCLGLGVGMIVTDVQIYYLDRELVVDRHTSSVGKACTAERLGLRG